MKSNLSKSLQVLADKVVYAETTSSEYYNIGCIKVRVSDHMASEIKCDLMIFSNVLHKHFVYTIIPMVGTYKQVQWFSNVNDVINFILKFEEMARLMLKYPEKPDNIQERQKANIETKAIELFEKNEEKVDYTTWRQKLQSFYTNKPGELIDELIEHIFKTTHGSKKVLKEILKLAGDKKGVKCTKLSNLIKTL